MRAAIEHRNTMFSLIENWQQSGLSQKAFCEQQQIAAHQFYYWYKCYRIQNDVPARLQRGLLNFIRKCHSLKQRLKYYCYAGTGYFFISP